MSAAPSSPPPADATTAPTRASGLRLWPGVTIVVLQWLLWLVLPRIVPGNTAGMIAALGAMAGGLLVFGWWLFFSRAAPVERLGAVGLSIVGIAGARLVLHPSMATAGQGFLFFVYALPVLSLALVAWAVLTRRLGDGARRLSLVAVLLAACFGWALVRTGGISASGSDFAWRWAPTPEEELLASRAGSRAPTSGQAELADRAAWPGFRGAKRDGVTQADPIRTDWEAAPPRELWRRPIGPGWSSFAVQGDALFTQEQLGEEEMVSCYRLSTGEPIWRHRDAVRFWESNAGAGPRATPTLAGGKVYSFGATGILNALAATDGALLWSRNVATDAEVEVPQWGFSSSPLVLDDLVVVAAAGKLAAYERSDGSLRWVGPDGGNGYSSPHAARFDGDPQILLVSGYGIRSLSPQDGRVLWEQEDLGYPIVQPAFTADGDVLVGSDGEGIHRLQVRRDGDSWDVEALWESNRLKPYFNDFVVHGDHAYGFDGTILASIRLEDGQRNWKGGRYGQGQLILLPDQDLLLVVTEEGEVALVSATPEGYREVAKVPSLEGKTWNHPVLVGSTLLVRNGQEMVAYEVGQADA